MKVYTRTGDGGYTSLFNGARVPKNHFLVDAYGTVDECNSAIGLAASYLSAIANPQNTDRLYPPTSQAAPIPPSTDPNLRLLLTRLQLLQQNLFDLGAHLATPRPTSSAQKQQRTAFPPHAATRLEEWIDDMQPQLQPLSTFVLPGGHPAAAALHLARTIARRAERAVTPLVAQDEREGEGEGNVEGDEGAVESDVDVAAYKFLNRLSDFLFVASRYANLLLGCSDVTWKSWAATVNEGDNGAQRTE